MRKQLAYGILTLVMIGFHGRLQGQGIFFRQLGYSDGLTATSIWHTTIDKHGFLWIASQDGLFMYDGYSVSNYNQGTYPQLPSNNIGYLFCDSKNRVWIQTSNGIAMMDENRRLHHVNIPGYTVSNTLNRLVFEVAGYGIVAISPAGCFVLAEGTQNWKPFTWLNQILDNNGAVDIRHFNDNSQLISIRNKKIVLLDIARQKVLLDLPLPNALGVCRINDDEILAGTDGKWGLYRISLSQKKIIKEYPAQRDINNRELFSGVVMMEKAADGLIYISTRRNGLIRFNPVTETFEHFAHDAMNNHSLNDNGLKMVVANETGLLAVTSSGGVNYTNVKYPVIGHNMFFRDAKGNVLDIAVNGVSTRNDDIFVTSPLKVVRWNRSSGISYVLSDLTEKNYEGPVTAIPLAIETDQQGRAWVGLNGDGIRIYDQHDKLVRHLFKELPSTTIRVLKRLQDGSIMAGAENGFFQIDPLLYTVDTFARHPDLQKIRHKRVIDIYSTGTDLWIAASPGGGAYRYNFSSRVLKTYSTSNGLSSDRAYCITGDQAGNIYVGGFDGLSIIYPDDSINVINTKNGLLNTRVESIEADDSGFVWFTNNSNLGRYDPVQKKLAYFNEQNGITSSGFGVESSHKSAAGELFFGSGKGLVYFTPRKIQPYLPALELVIEKTIDGKNYVPFTKDSVLKFYKEGKITFLITGSDIINNQQLYYRYKMDGLDTTWSEPSRARSFAYSLEPGKYRLHVQASYDRLNFHTTAITGRILVRKPFTQTWLFWTSVLLILIAGFAWFYWIRINTLRRKLQVQQQLAELEARALRAQMNPHFIFNSLNAIQECIVGEKIEEAFQYLSKFSKLMRMVLSNSEKNLIPLSSELEMLRLYLSLESLRFRQSFEYTIEISEELDTEEILVPPLLVQPYVENSIWHGLRLKEGEKKLYLSFSQEGEYLRVVVEDNGVGVERSAELNKQKLGARQYESKGMLLTAQRIEMINKQYHASANTHVVDLTSEATGESGTRVIVLLPLDISVQTDKYPP